MKPSLSFKGIGLVLLGSWISLGQAKEDQATLSNETLTLQAAYQSAVAQNPNLESQRDNEQVAVQNKRVAVAKVLPQLNTQASYGRQHNFANASSPDAAYNSASLNVNASQVLLDLPSFKALTLAGTQIKAEQYRLLSTEQTLIFDVADQYFQVVESEENLKLKKQEAQESARLLEEAQARFKVGLGAQTDVEEARATFDTNQANIIVAEENLNNQLKKMALLCNVSELTSEQFPQLKTILKKISEVHRSYAEWFQLSESHHPDWQAARLDEQAAHENVMQKQAGHFPSLQFQLSDSRTRSETTDPVSGGPLNYTAHQQTALGVATWNVFQGGQVLAQTGMARAQEAQKHQQLESIRRGLEEKLENAFSGVISSQSEMRALAQSIRSGQAALEATEAGFTAGTRTRLNVLEQLSKLYAQKRKWVGSKLTFFRNFLKLKQAAGVLTSEDLVMLDAQFQDKTTG